MKVTTGTDRRTAIADAAGNLFRVETTTYDELLEMTGATEIEVD